MKFLFLLALITFPLSSFAQNRTGGGGTFKPPTDPLGTKIDIPVEIYKTGGGNAQESKLYDFTFSLQKQEKLCRTDDKRFIYLKNSDLMDTYLKLSVLHSTFEADDKCSNLSDYYNCLYSSEVKERLNKVLLDPEMNTHLREKYKIKKKEAKGILHFFKTLDSKCKETSGCKVQDL